jgi:dephospho-CoA kinase
MLKVGLTGGIAIGKSFVSKVFTELGCHVFDADKIARDVVASGTTGFQQVVAEFGSEILAEDGSINRTKLGQIVFGNESKRQRLNAILHPLIIAEQDRLLSEAEAKDPKGIAIIEATLMIETGSYKRLDKIIVVHCDREIQIERLMHRNNYSREEAESRLSAQMPNEEKIKFADIVIDTSGGKEQTRQKVIEAYEQLRALAQAM